MLIVHVHIHVKPECVEAFRDATIENAQNSVREPGIARFDVIQEKEDPTKFALLEAYRDEAAITAHKATAHYAKWKAVAEPMMAGERRRSVYSNVFPGDAGW
jgi:quinol monooxygenase YgiN